MFGQNKIVGRKFFADAPEGHLYVTSIFYTLQGEGPFAGKPAVFLRLGKCNLACDFCDTYFDHGEYMSFAAIHRRCIDVIEERFKAEGLPTPGWAYAPNGYGYSGCILVITGGEPTLQPNLAAFIRQQYPLWEDIQLETNGTQEVQAPTHQFTMVCSPKVINGEYRRLAPAVKAQVIAWKFVLSADPASPYHQLPSWVFEVATPSSIYVSPMNVYLDQPKEMKIAVMRDGVPSLEMRSTVLEKVSFWEPGILDLEANRANHEYAAQYCMLYGTRLNLQTHLYASIA